MDIYRITKEPIDVASALVAIGDDRAGAQALFLGTVRNEFAGRASRGLYYDAYEPLAEKELRRIGDELKQDFGALHVVLIHRIGELPLGEVSVLVAVSAGHRTEAFAAAREGIDRIKSRVPIWKKEHWDDGQDAWHDDPEAFSPK
ncbi:MAG: molybdopterin synthase [Sulfobacillus benefaciens]|uniref:Molybdopterin synthase n=1 Tax=Sulfobacillus benefaciens TaxID=453960 RepID=A0A2T2XCY0_9FIRM|nr:MAG: molybdopterin synthase [Sulfobacillus benefaciens]